MNPKNDLSWKWIPSHGRSGGILGGIRNDSFELVSYKLGNYVLQFNLWDKRKKCNWNLLTVYGAAHEEFKDVFLTKLAAFCNTVDGTYIIGGDFNILRHGVGGWGRRINYFMLPILLTCLILSFILLS